MVRGMSDNNGDTRSEARKQIDDWMFGGGSKVLAGIVIALVAWFIVTRFW